MRKSVGAAVAAFSAAITLGVLATPALASQSGNTQGQSNNIQGQSNNAQK
jgi:hypothetical protein